MDNEKKLIQQVEDAASQSDVSVKSTKPGGDRLFIEADSLENLNSVPYFAALIFYKCSDYDFETVAIRDLESGQTPEYDLNEVLGYLLRAYEQD